MPLKFPKRRILLALTLHLLPAFALAGSNPVTFTATGLNYAQSLDPSKDSIVLHYLPDASGIDSGPYLFDNISPGDNGYSIWRDITIEVQPGSTPGIMEIHTALDAFSPPNDSAEYTINTERLTLVDTGLNSAASWAFESLTSNTINLLNSSFGLSSPSSIAFSDAPLTINAVRGNNAIDGWVLSRDITAPTTINVLSGSTFAIRNIGTDVNSRGLNFRGGVTLVAVGAAVSIENSVVSATNDNLLDDAEWSFIGSSLTLSGSSTSLTLDRLVLDNSTFTLGNFSLFNGDEASFTDSTVLLDPTSRFHLTGLELSGTNTFRGLGVPQTVEIGSMNAIVPGTTLTLDNVDTATIKSGLILDDNLDIYLQNSSKLVIFEPLILDGGSISADNLSTLVMRSNNAINLGGGADFFASNFGSILINEDAELSIGNNVSVDLSDSGSLKVNGKLSGNGAISVSGGDGYFRVIDGGVISPDGGSFHTSIGTISSDARISFYTDLSEEDMASYSPSSQQELLASGLFDGGMYVADLMIDQNGIARNDLLEYGDGGIYLAQLGSLVANVHGSPTASELDGKEFTVIAAKAGKTGNNDIELLNQDITLLEAGSTPALIDFQIIDRNTNGHQDITLLAEASHENLVTNPLLTTNNHNSGAQLLVNAAQNGNSVISNSLDSLTNAQLIPHMDSFHAESYSSYMTVSLEHTDMLMNSVLSNTNLDMTLNTNKKTDSSKKHFWMDAVYSKGEIDGSSGLGDFDYTLTSVVVGNDFISTDNRRAGMYVSFGKQEIDEHDTIVQNFDGKNYYIGGYLNQKLEGDWNFGSILGYGYGKHQSNRSVILSNLSKNLEADFNSHSIYGGVKISKQTYQNSWVTLTPEAGLDYTYYQQDKIHETGDSDLSLIIDKADAQSIIASIGVNAQFDSLSEQNNIYPLAFIRYEHDFYANQNNGHEIDASLSAHPDYKQTFVGQNRGENSIITGIGIGSNINSALQINGGLVFTKHTHGKEWGAGLSLEYTW